ncbi:hypothetical protein CesoFtcFv8_015669 [Champsocephalus esox]|uniref:Uncharacterized protein n=1 Tax=Champsocephalus esox TaxID=159716 RepID=A0AAN8GTJ9_9TELE|nr:hypothetical protein CesoFtcFv8_015669 [Champsocephalus esox]
MHRCFSLVGRVSGRCSPADSEWLRAGGLWIRAALLQDAGEPGAGGLSPGPLSPVLQHLDPDHETIRPADDEDLYYMLIEQHLPGLAAARWLWFHPPVFLMLPPEFLLPLRRGAEFHTGLDAPFVGSVSS